MKPLEEALGSRTVRRVVLPGIVLTLGLHPSLGALLSASGRVYGIGESGVILAVEALFWGLLISSAVNPIYYVYEGFRLRWLTSLARRFNEKRLRRHAQALGRVLGTRSYDDLSPAEQDAVSRCYEVLGDYPLQRSATGDAQRVVERPTRLGNIIATYELYPETRYGMDGVYFWHHLLACAPAALLAEFEEQYGFAESLLLTSAAGACVALVNAAVLAGLAVGAAFPSLALLPVVTGVFGTLALAAFGLATMLLFYQLALPAHREAGAVFRAMVDLGVPAFNEWVQKAAPPGPELQARMSAAHGYLAELKPGLTAAVDPPPGGRLAALVARLRRFLA